LDQCGEFLAGQCAMTEGQDRYGQHIAHDTTPPLGPWHSAQCLPALAPLPIPRTWCGARVLVMPRVVPGISYPAAMSTSGRRDSAHQSAAVGSRPAGRAVPDPRASATAPTDSTRSARRIVLLVAIVLVAIPFLIALWMLIAGATSAPDTDGRGV